LTLTLFTVPNEWLKYVIVLGTTPLDTLLSALDIKGPCPSLSSISIESPSSISDSGVDLSIVSSSHVIMYHLVRIDSSSKFIVFSRTMHANQGVRYPVVNLLFYKGYYMRMKMMGQVSEVLNFSFCHSCSRWIKHTTPKGSLHFRTCHRCANCKKSLLGELSHVCIEKVYDPVKMLLSPPASRRAYKVPTAAKKGILKSLDWNHREHIYACDFETFTNPTVNQMQVYATGTVNFSTGSYVLITYGTSAMSDYMKWLLSLKEGVIYFFNGSAFDLIPILHYLLSHGISLEDKAIIKQGKRIISLKLPNSVIMRDACLMIPSSLDSACKSFSVPSDLTKGDFDHSKVFSYASAEIWRDEVIPYLKNDCLSLRWIVRALGSTVFDMFHLDLSNFITLSHLTNHAWAISDPETSKNIIIPTRKDWEEWGCVVRGGRVVPQMKSWESTDPVSARYNERKDFCVFLDCNSLYPYVMSEGDFMTGRWRIISDGLTLRHRDINSRNQLLRHSIFLCDVECPTDLLVAYLPSRVAGEIIYDLMPKVSEVYNGEELMHAVELGYEVTRVRKEWRFTQDHTSAKRMFKTYIDTLYKTRQTYGSKDARNVTCKYLMNSLFGKTCQRPNGTQTVLLGIEDAMSYEQPPHPHPPVVFHQICDSDGTIIGYMGDLIDMEAEPTQPFYIGARILSLSRIHMSRSLASVGGYRMPRRTFFYTDTDSLILRAECVDALDPSLLGLALGQFKDDIDGGEDIINTAKIIAVAILAPKMYAVVYQNKEGKMFQKIRAKGISHPMGAIECNSLDDRAAHSNDLAARVQEIELWRCGQAPLPRVGPRFRAFVATFLDGSSVTLPYLSYGILKAILLRKLTSLRAYSGVFKINYVTTNWQGSGLSITPSVITRLIADSNWWDKGKRIFLQDIDFTVPVGYKTY